MCNWTGLKSFDVENTNDDLFKDSALEAFHAMPIQDRFGVLPEIPMSKVCKSIVIFHDIRGLSDGVEKIKP